MTKLWSKLREFSFHIIITLSIIGLYITVVIVQKQLEALHPAHNLPCKYFDSINITDGVHQPNGDIIYKNIIYSKDQYAQVNTVLGYDEKKDGEFVKVPPYYRGCLCKRKKCMRICCAGKCEDDFENAFKVVLSHSPFTTLVNNDFNFINELMGRKLHPADGNITNDGVLIGKNRSYEHHEFCLCYNSKERKILGLMKRVSDEVDNAVKKLNVRKACMPYLLFTSVPFTMATFFVYILIPDLRNLHGKCLLCYLVSLVIFQPLFGWIYINDDRYVKPLPCKLVGYTTYFASQSAFLWLSVISFDLWWNFRKTSGFMLSEKKRFIFYTIYALGLSLLMTLLTLTMDYIPGIPETFQPLMGKHMCFLQKEWNTRLFYFYLPQFILCSVNILFFVLTAFKIRLLQIDLNKVMAQGENGKHQCRLQSEKENFNLFLRLFIVMGVIWFMESFSFLVDSESIYFFFFDVWNCLQGVLIFAFMVCKRRVFRLIKKRYQAIIKKSTASSITTNSSSVTYATNNIALNQMTATRDKNTEKL